MNFGCRYLVQSEKIFTKFKLQFCLLFIMSEIAEIRLLINGEIVETCIIDKEDEERVKLQGPWYLAAGYVKNNNTRIHNFILNHFGTTDGLVIDHHNRNPLDNRKCNLRLITQAANIQNKRKASGMSSQYFGVSWDRVQNKWRASTEFGQSKKISIGLYENEEEAAYAYNVFVLNVDKNARINEGVGEFPEIKFSKKFAAPKNYVKCNSKYRAYMRINGLIRTQTVDTIEDAEELVKQWSQEKLEQDLIMRRKAFNFDIKGDTAYFYGESLGNGRI